MTTPGIDSGFATLLAVVTVEGVGIAFWAGSISARLKALESDVRPLSSLSEKLAKLEERIAHLLDRLELDPHGRERGR